MQDAETFKQHTEQKLIIKKSRNKNTGLPASHKLLEGHFENFGGNFQLLGGIFAVDTTAQQNNKYIAVKHYSNYTNTLY